MDYFRIYEIYDGWNHATRAQRIRCIFRRENRNRKTEIPDVRCRMQAMIAGSVPGQGYRAPAREKGLEILDVPADSSLPLSQVELAQRFGRSHGEFFRMLICLEKRGYAVRESESGRFKLSLRLHEFGHKQNASTMLRNAARVPMGSLAERAGQARHLSVQSAFAASDEAFQARSSRERKSIVTAFQSLRDRTYVIAESSVTEGVTDVATITGVPGTDTLGVLVIPYLADFHRVKRDTPGYLKAIRQCASELNRNLGIIG
jgi:DNA-binding IclR family transcriptional regulator